MIRYKGLYERKFEVCSVMVSLLYEDEHVVIAPQGLSETAMREVVDELVYDGYAGNAEVDDGKIYLEEPDPWLCVPYTLKEAIAAQLNEMGFEPTFLL